MDADADKEDEWEKLFEDKEIDAAVAAAESSQVKGAAYFSPPPIPSLRAPC